MNTQHITGPVIALFISVSALLGQGEGSLWALYETGDCPDFVEAARRQPIDSLSAQLCFYTGVCFKELSDFQSALEFLDQAIRKDPDMAMAYFY